MKIIELKSNDGKNILFVHGFTEKEIESLRVHGQKIRERQKKKSKKG